MKKKRIKVLGTDYTLIFCDERERPKLKDCDGYMDFTVKECVVDGRKATGSSNELTDIEYYKRKVARHEIIHAFLIESGLNECSKWADDEEMVDWIARQMPKIAETMIRAGVL